jgi:hypothetical protein
MAYRLTIEKFHAGTGEYWTNIYWTTAADGAAAGAAMDAIVAAERPLYHSTVRVTKGRWDDGVEGSAVYGTSIYNQSGTSPLADVLLPLFNVARVDFGVAGPGRPSRKYLRGVLTEAASDFTTLAAQVITMLTTYGAAVVAQGTICDPQGQLFTQGFPWQAPAMRQLRRGSKKKDTPSLPGTPL